MPKESHLILNADDLISSNLGSENEKTYFSINRLPSDREECINLINDMRICPKCHHKLKYNYVRYHHIGKAVCEFCGYTSPEGDYKADVDYENKVITVTHNESREQYPMISNSTFNLYNELTAVTALREFGLTGEQIRNAIQNLNIVESRYSRSTVDGITIVTNMAKGQNQLHVPVYLIMCLRNREIKRSFFCWKIYLTGKIHLKI